MGGGGGGRERPEEVNWDKVACRDFSKLLVFFSSSFFLLPPPQGY